MHSVNRRKNTAFLVFTIVFFGKFSIKFDKNKKFDFRKFWL